MTPRDERQRKGHEGLTNDCHVGGLGQGKEGWSDGDLAEVGAGEVDLHVLDHHAGLVGCGDLEEM